MKKLHLSLESLRVDSFTTDAHGAARGTVHGESIIEPSGYTYCIPCGGGGDETDYCGVETEMGYPTCDDRPDGECAPKTE